MDQDAFRKLLETPRAGPSPGPSRRLLLPTKTSRDSTKSALEAAPNKSVFKPRKVAKKKQERVESDYRDRAAERRSGNNEYAEIEGILEDFERKTASNADREAVDEQRRYLGGDGAHSILVKGLDFALLEQNKARLEESQNQDLDEALEDAYKAATSSVTEPSSALFTVPKKRNREDLIRELKKKRNEGLEPSSIGAEFVEKGKQLRKFKPIGAPKPSATKRKGVEEGELKKMKKKRLIPPEESMVSEGSKPQEEQSMPLPSVPLDRGLADSAKSAKPIMHSPSPTHIEEDPSDFDIFANAANYEGIDFDSDDETSITKGSQDKAPSVLNINWFGESTDGNLILSSFPGPHPTTPPLLPSKERTRSPSPVPTRLVPLSSSALPSISDFLKMDAEAEKAEKWKARKEKLKKESGSKKKKGDESD